MKKRLQTVLAHAGITSRRKAAELIESGKVKIDGRPAREKGLRIDPGEHEITVNGRPIPGEEKKYYFLFNKPRGVISTLKDTHGRRKVTDFFKDINARIYPVGRLDRDTTGILVMTNDGGLAHKLSHPSFITKKEYTVRVRSLLSRRDIREMEKGVRLDGKMTSPCEIKLVRSGAKGAVYRMKLHEGRKRQIKRMFEAKGERVLQLKRTRYAHLTLKGLKEGEYRELTAEEIMELKSVGEK